MGKLFSFFILNTKNYYCKLDCTSRMLYYYSKHMSERREENGSKPNQERCKMVL